MDTDSALFFLVVANAGVLIFWVILVILVTKPWRKKKHKNSGRN